MMFALGCIQAQECNLNTCPTGVATQDPGLVAGLAIPNKAARVANYHRNTVHAFNELIGASGLKDPEELRPWHIYRRVTSSDIRHYGEIYEYLEAGALLGDTLPESLARPWRAADPRTFRHAKDDPDLVKQWPPSLPPPVAD